MKRIRGGLLRPAFSCPIPLHLRATPRPSTHPSTRRKRVKRSAPFLLPHSTIPHPPALLLPTNFEYAIPILV